MFYVRINKIRIVKNGELIGKGELQLMCFINHSEVSFPSLESFFETTDVDEQNKLIESAIKQVVQSRILMPIHKVKDKSIITFGDTGYIVYKANKIPTDFSIQLLGIEKDKKARNNATILKNILSKENLNTIVDNISSLVSETNPVNKAIVVLFDLVAQSILTLVSNDKDDQVGYFLSSFIRELDYPHGTRDRQDVTDLTGNMFVDYTLFGTD
ncbi:hypothetical protein [Flavobacterium sp.]|uniref:hypothetical protein n=1 Tax=Flavobacterium sp. TaxID=239 RepID=UPI00391DB62F